MKKIKLIALFLLLGFGIQAQILVIVNKDNPNKELTSRDIKNYFLKKTRTKWKGSNEAVKPVIINGGNESKTAFNSKVLDMSENEINRHFVQLQYSSAAKPPQKVNTEKEAVDFVANNPGGIAYVKVGTTLPPNVVVLMKVE